MYHELKYKIIKSLKLNDSLNNFLNEIEQNLQKYFVIPNNKFEREQKIQMKKREGQKQIRI